ncbi:unnamed protein product [Pedinophyceae sp. YPF-701]|nr:unnamed protein product [Pedinophyceae sp. YPF-701]
MPYSLRSRKKTVDPEKAVLVGHCGVPLCSECLLGADHPPCRHCGQRPSCHLDRHCPEVAGQIQDGPDDYGRTVAVMVLSVEGPRPWVLLQKRSNHLSGAGRWAFPSGFVKHASTPVDAARSEIAEEAGVHLPAPDVSPAAVTQRDWAGEAPNGTTRRRLHTDVVFLLWCPAGVLPRCGGPLPSHAWEVGAFEAGALSRGEEGLPVGARAACEGHAWVPVGRELARSPGLWRQASASAEWLVGDAGPGLLAGIAGE